MLFRWAAVLSRQHQLYALIELPDIILAQLDASRRRAHIERLNCPSFAPPVQHHERQPARAPVYTVDTIICAGIFTGQPPSRWEGKSNRNIAVPTFSVLRSSYGSCSCRMGLC